jgi:hypothetical protein
MDLGIALLHMTPSTERNEMTTYPIYARQSVRSGIARRLIAGTVLGAMLSSVAVSAAEAAPSVIVNGLPGDDLVTASARPATQMGETGSG